MRWRREKKGSGVPHRGKQARPSGFAERRLWGMETAVDALHVEVQQNSRLAVAAGDSQEDALGSDEDRAQSQAVKQDYRRGSQTPVVGVPYIGYADRMRGKAEGRPVGGTLDGRDISLLNVYAPNCDDKRFFGEMLDVRLLGLVDTPYVSRQL
ncbi:hypothetical protein NDU88_006295 [Pleurodeles waltl]|uniref:Uncharacterized protein n=1 Tax=Pleurodeles waltl TaxID=8319 RepID=A0AAV7RPJ9_PLEWA|nr:hypothetical protein NDU88_006295 [Pleurodeles waltl]